MGVVTRVGPDSKVSSLEHNYTMDLHRPVNKQILTLTAEERIDTTQDMQEIADKLTQTVKE